MANLPATFGRTGGSKAVGCLVYFAATPFVALFLAIAIQIPVQFALKTFDIREEISKSVVVLISAIIVIGTTLWAFRDYRRRADLNVTIRQDRVVVQLGSREDDLPFAEVNSIRLVPAGLDLACLLVRQRGRPLRLSPEVAPFSLVRDALEETLIPLLVQRLDRRLEAGELVTVRENVPRSLLVIARGLTRSLISIVMIFNPLRIELALAHFRRGILVTRQGWLGTRGGFVLEKRGICPRSDGKGERIPWDRVERIHVDEVGLVLRSQGGPTFGVSALAEDFWPTLRWINARLLKTKSLIDRL